MKYAFFRTECLTFFVPVQPDKFIAVWQEVVKNSKHLLIGIRFVIG